MSKSKLFSIITIACFVSVLFIPIGIVLMIYYTSWKKKTKVIITLSLTAFYAAIFAIVFLIKPAYNTGGIGLPFGSNSGYTAFDSGVSGGGGTSSARKSSGSGKKNKDTANPSAAEKLPKKVKQRNGGNAVIYPILFFLFMLFLIIWQNLRSKGKSNYENPYVDTNKYKLPLTPDSKMPMVHFMKAELEPDEKIYFATETNQKDNEGNLVITSRRVIIMNITGQLEIPVTSVSYAGSVTSTVMTISFMNQEEEEKQYIFMPENQMKYALAVIRWAAGLTNKSGDSK